MVETFAQLLKHHRLVAGLSQERLGELAGISADAISLLERGARRAPYKTTLDLLIGALALDDTARHEIEEAATVARAHRSQAQLSGQAAGLLDNVPLNNLAPRLTSFVGRENDVANIKELLASHRFVTLVGTGGGGKTRCAIEVARGLLDEYEHGIWLVELATTSDPSLVARLIARTLGLQEAPNRSELDTLLAFLKRKHLLIVLDNCEHVIEEARRVVAAILKACPNVQVLATSREGFSIGGEQAYRLPSLPVPSAMQLFCDRAVSADNQFVLALETAPHVAEVCRRLDGIPLAIELAAARITVLSPQQLSQKLGERFRVLTAGDRSAMPRHRTMRALIDWSYDLLSDEERRLFRRLSIFTAYFTLELAAAVCSDSGMDEITVLDLLSSLVDKSLVQTQLRAGETRYRLLESTREYAREKLIEAGEEYAVAREHARAFLARAEQLRDDVETTPDAVWLALVESELVNFRSALAWTLSARGDVPLGQQLAGALETVWRYFPTEGRRWVQAASDLITADTPASVLAALDVAEAQQLIDLNQKKASLQAAERALARYVELADPRGIARSQLLIGRALIYLGEIAEGEALAEQVLESARDVGSRRLVVYALQNLAFAREFSGDLFGARQRYTEALAVARTVGAERSVALVAMNLAEAEFRSGDVHAALRLADEALPILASGDTFLVSTGRSNLAAYLVASCRFDEARIAAREALGDARDIQWSVGLVWALQHLAAIGALVQETAAPQVEQRRRAARILGFVDTRLAALETAREYTEQREYDAMISSLGNILGENELLKLLAEGSIWSEDQAIAEAMLI